MQDTPLDEVHTLEERLEKAALPARLREEAQGALDRLTRMAKMGTYPVEYERIAKYIDWIMSLPWSAKSEDVLDMAHAHAILERNHYGMRDIKDRILEYIATLILKRQQATEEEPQHATTLALIGLVGTGKTSFAESIAQALGRSFARIPFGGLGDARSLRGESKILPDADPGYIVKALRRVGKKNPVMLLDEVDRVAGEHRADIMGVLVELLDPEQNRVFVDHYIDFPFDISEVLFIVTANNTTNIATAVLDRLEVLQMPSYTDEEKIHIGSSFLLPRALHESGVPTNVVGIDADVWPEIVRPLGFDAGMRTLERSIQTMTRRMARMLVEGEQQAFHITRENIRDYLSP